MSYTENYPKEPDCTVEWHKDSILGLAAYDAGFVILQPHYGIGETNPLNAKEWAFAAYIPHPVAIKLGELAK